jgi:hypothetical protein
VLGFIDRATDLGQTHLLEQVDNVFYREATFFSAPEVDALLAAAGFVEAVWVQTLSKPLEQIKEIEPIRSGHGQGLFAAVAARRP